jgi:hypothetical protein
MERTKLKSSTIKSAGYDPVRLILEVEFADGHVYQYENIIPAIADEFMKAESPGAYLNKVIKKIHMGNAL